MKAKGNVAATIKGKKKGMAKVQAVIGKQKLTCNVIVKDAENNNTPKPDTTKFPVPSTSTQPEVTTTPPTATQAPPTNPAVTDTPPSSSNPINVPEGTHEQDVAALTELIAEQRERGATVSEDLDNDRQYTWEDGRLTGIHWYEKDLSGEMDISKFTALKELYCGQNHLTSLDVSHNTALTILSCGGNQLTSELTSLDVSRNTALTSLKCDESVTVTGYNK